VALARRGHASHGHSPLGAKHPEGADLASTTIAASQVTSTDYRTPTWVEVPLDLEGSSQRGRYVTSF